MDRVTRLESLGIFFRRVGCMLWAIKLRFHCNNMSLRRELNMKNVSKSIICEIIAGVVSLFFWGQVTLFLFRINSFKAMFDAMGGELPFITQIVMQHFVVAIPLVLSILLFLLSFIPAIRSNRLKNGITIGLSLGITLLTLAICIYGAYAPMSEMVNMVG